MIRLIDEQLTKKTSLFLVSVSVALILIIGFFDYLTGYEINFFIFYIAPIWLVSWYGNRSIGRLLSVFCVIIWFLVDHSTGRQYSQPIIPYWNGLMRLTIFIYIVYSLSNIKAKLKLEELNANYDSLTGILNSRGMREKSDILLSLIKREQRPYSVAFIDVDNFKLVNDTLGHKEGDKVLKSVAKSMKDSLRSSDLVSRLGGDEFVIFLPNTNLEQARTVIDGLKMKLDIDAADNKWPIGFSLGVCSFNSDRTNLEDAIALTDTLMYKVKKQGKGSVLYNHEP